jgi:hypothetical protein
VTAPSTLHPRLHDEAVLAELRRAWAAGGGAIRIAEVLAPGLADDLARAAMTRLPYEAYHQPAGSRVRCFFWRCVIDAGAQVRGEARGEPPFDQAADLVLRDLPWLARTLGGRSLAPPAPLLGFCRYRKGCYLDAHEDEWEGAPAAAFVLGLTRERWPASEGGHLTFLAEDRVTALGTLPPGFDTLDLYDVHPVPRWHAVPLLEVHRERLTLSGLLVDQGEGPG